MVYFSSAPVAPESLDASQYETLKKFRQWCQSKGLIEEFENLVDLRAKFTRQLQITLRDNPYLRGLLSKTESVSIATVPMDSLPGALLSREAKELLLEAAADRSGQILKLRTLNGTSVQTNKKAFGGGGDPRAEARWEFALEQLVEHRLITSVGSKGEFFKMTTAGYALADSLKGTEP